MCRTVHNVISSFICMIQMFLRVTMTVILMLENLIRMILQTAYNTISFILQLLSLLPICIIILVTARMKCFMCGGGGGCPNRGGAGGCDCLMTFVAMALLFLIFRATGVLDKIFYRLGYAKAPQLRAPGAVTQCSRNDTEYYDDETEKGTTLNARRFHMRASEKDLMNVTEAVATYDQITEEQYSELVTADPSTTPLLTDSSNFVPDVSYEVFDDDDNTSMLTSVGLSSPLTTMNEVVKKHRKDNLTDLIYVELSIEPRTPERRARIRLKPKPSKSSKKPLISGSEMTTVLYYLV